MTSKKHKLIKLEICTINNTTVTIKTDFSFGGKACNVTE